MVWGSVMARVLRDLSASTGNPGLARIAAARTPLPPQAGGKTSAFAVKSGSPEIRSCIVPAALSDAEAIFLRPEMV